jgi:hypothetical protein
MRARKLLKISAISVASLALLVLFLVAFFLFNPFEGSLPNMRAVVPRGVDFFFQKSNIRDDFTLADGSSASDQFPYVPALENIGKSTAWGKIRRGAWYQELGIGPQLAGLRAQFLQMREDTSFLHLVDDLIGEEVQIAGRFGVQGLDDATWCAYTRVSWRGKAAFGLLERDFMREEMARQGLFLTDDDGGFYKLHVKKDNQDLFLTRFKDCVMIANDRQLLVHSLELAEGNTQNVESLEVSSHYRNGVHEPLMEWIKRTGVDDPNALEMHFNVRELIPKISFFDKWPDASNDENRNEKILASFINKKSYRFLSGSLIFEPYSISMLSHLVVNNNELSAFQKPIYTADPTPRVEWMNKFFNLVPRDACGAAAMKINAGAFIREMFEDALVKDERDLVDQAIRQTHKYKGFDDLVRKLSVSLESRVGVILRPNRRGEGTKKLFKVKFDSPFPQWAWVFWVKKGSRSKRVMNQPFKDLITHINANRRAFAIVHAQKLALSRAGVQSDVAFEFAIPDIAGTGSIAVATLGEYFIFGNSGPFIRRMVEAMVDGRSRRTEDEFVEFVQDMPSAMNGVVFLWADKLKEVAEDFENYHKKLGGGMDPSFGFKNRSRAEVFAFRKPRWSPFGSIAKIPEDQVEAFEADVLVELRKLWGAQHARNLIADQATLKQFSQFVRTFKAAYLQMVLTETSLKVWGRVLSPEYGR